MTVEVEKSLDALVWGYVGRGVLSARVNEEGHLLLKMSDGQEVDVGSVSTKLDATLSKSGCAADAKATGEKISGVQQTANEACMVADDAKSMAQTAWEKAENAQSAAEAAGQRAEEAWQLANEGGGTGTPGADGYTPVKGVDYYTEADKAEIVQQVIESLGGNPVFGYVDENNNIVVSGNLPNGTYAVKYEMEDGSTVDIGELVLDESEPEEPIPTYTNQIPVSTDASGNLFVGTNGEKGYKTGYRLSLSSGNESATEGYECTGFIPVKLGDTIRIKNIDCTTNENQTNVVVFNSSKQPINGGTSTYGTSLYNLFVTNGTNADGVYTAKLSASVHGCFTSDLAYVRLGSKAITAESILTVNEEIL